MAESATNFAGLGPGYFVNMIYTSPTSPSRTTINFKSGNDIAFHCNPRYDEQALVMNTCVNGQWQHEERPPGFPLGYSQPTQVVAAIGDHTMDVFANKGQFCYSYRHRYDTSKINQIQCSGIPHKAWVGKALPNYEVGKVVYIKGQSGVDFNIDMVPSLPNNYRTENFAMHVSFRFKENAVVRNHKTNEQWGAEERAGGMPLVPGQPFSITIVAQKTGFEIGVNGSHFCFFKYRVPLTREMSVEMIRAPFIEKIDYN